MMARPMTMVSTTLSETVTPATLTDGSEKMAETLCGRLPNSTMARFCRKMLMARAVIKADMGPALRTGR